MPATHAAQVPVAPHTMSVPQEVPAATLVLVSVHVGAAPEQTSVPVWHRFVGVQAPPAWQVAHVPAWQTIPVPHAVPFGLLSVSVQTGAPVVQTMLPTRHGLPVTSHAMPSVHAPQLPLRQTMFDAADGSVRLRVGQLHARHRAFVADEHPLVARVGRDARAASDTVADGNVHGTGVDEHRVATARVEGVRAAARAAARAEPELPPVPAAASTPAELPPMPAVPPSLP